jgi:hypothetical protein
VIGIGLWILALASHIHMIRLAFPENSGNAGNIPPHCKWTRGFVENANAHGELLSVKDVHFDQVRSPHHSMNTPPLFILQHALQHAPHCTTKRRASTSTVSLRASTSTVSFNGSALHGVLQLRGRGQPGR